MSRPRSVQADSCLVCFSPDLYALGLCKTDYYRRRAGKPDRTEEEAVQRRYHRWVLANHNHVVLTSRAKVGAVSPQGQT